MPRRAMKTASHPGLIQCCRTASLRRRLILFLATAFPFRLLTTKPNRVRSKSLARKRTTKRRLAALAPSRWISEKRLLPVSRSLRCIARRQLLHGQVSSAFEPSPAQDSAPVRSARAGAKAVNSGAAAFLWLIRSFRHRLKDLLHRDYRVSQIHSSRPGAWSVRVYSSSTIADPFDYAVATNWRETSPFRRA